MEALEAPITQTTPAPAAVSTPTPPAAPVASAAPPAPFVESSGSGSGGSVKEVLSSLNWVEVCFGILGSAALYYTIYYYRYKIGQQKTEYTTLANKIDEMEIKMLDMESSMTRDSIQAGFDGFSW